MVRPRLLAAAAVAMLMFCYILVFTFVDEFRSWHHRQFDHAQRQIGSLRPNEHAVALAIDINATRNVEGNSASRNYSMASEVKAAAEAQAAVEAKVAVQAQAAAEAAPKSWPRAVSNTKDSLSGHLSSCNMTAQRYECDAVAVSPSNKSCVHGHRSIAAGLGHQMSEVLMWLRYARLEKAAFLYEPFGPVVSAEHGNSYEFSDKFFGLREAVRSMRGIVIKDDASKPDYNCEHVKKPSWGDCGIPGSDVSCFVSMRMSKLFYEFSPCFRQSALCYGDWVHHARGLPFDPAVVNVAWHIRVGSGGYYYTTSSNFYREVLGFMAPFLRGRRSVQYLIGGNGWDNEHGDFVVHIQSIVSDLELSAECQVVPVFSSVKDSLLYLMSADVTVSTSSSFSDIAALFSSFPVYISPPPKHGVGANMLEYLPDGVYIDGWTRKSNKKYITNAFRFSELSSFQEVNNTLHQRLASRFPI